MSYEDLPEKQQKFIDLYLDCGDRDEAYRAAGYSIEGRGWKANARKLFMRLQLQIDERIEMRIGAGAVFALKIIREIMQDTEVPPAVRLNAAKDYLARAGYDRAQESRIEVSHEGKITDEELDAEIKRLHAEMQPRKSSDNQKGSVH